MYDGVFTSTLAMEYFVEGKEEIRIFWLFFSEFKFLRAYKNTSAFSTWETERQLISELAIKYVYVFRVSKIYWKM